MFFDKIKCLVDELDCLFKIYYKNVEQAKNENTFVTLVIGEEENSLALHLVTNEIDEDYIEISFSQQERNLYEYFSLVYIYHFFYKMNIMYDDEICELSNKFFYPYFKVIVLDDSLIDKIEELINAKNQFDIEQVEELLCCQYKEIKFWQRRINDRLIADLSKNVAKRKALLVRKKNQQ